MLTAGSGQRSVSADFETETRLGERDLSRLGRDSDVDGQMCGGSDQRKSSHEDLTALGYGHPAWVTYPGLVVRLFGTPVLLS